MPIVDSINYKQVKTADSDLPLLTKTRAISNGRKIQQFSKKEKIPFETKSQGLPTWQKVVIFGLILSTILIPPTVAIAYALSKNNQADATNSNLFTTDPASLPVTDGSRVFQIANSHLVDMNKPNDEVDSSTYCFQLDGDEANEDNTLICIGPEGQENGDDAASIYLPPGEVKERWTNLVQEALKQNGSKLLDGTMTGLKFGGKIIKIIPSTLWQATKSFSKKAEIIREIADNPTIDRMRYWLIAGIVTFVYMNRNNQNWNWFTK